MLLQGYVELVRRKGSTLSAERCDDLVQRASRAGESLAHLVQSILDTRRVDQQAKDFAPEAVPVAEMVVTAASLVDPGQGTGVERERAVQVPQEVSIWGEKVRLQQIMTNLLSNAIKYSAAGTPIEVNARVVSEALPRSNVWRLQRRNGGAGRAGRRMVEIEVRDHGLGIPPDQAPLLFQRFVRLPRDLASTTVGNGLGLYLCRELTEAMGGRIWVESTGVEGEGSTFYLRLPLSSPSAGAEAA